MWLVIRSSWAKENLCDTSFYDCHCKSCFVSRRNFHVATNLFSRIFQAVDASFWLQAIAEALKINKSVAEISLWRNRIGDEAVKAIQAGWAWPSYCMVNGPDDARPWQLPIQTAPKGALWTVRPQQWAGCFSPNNG